MPYLELCKGKKGKLTSEFGLSIDKYNINKVTDLSVDKYNINKLKLVKLH